MKKRECAIALMVASFALPLLNVSGYGGIVMIAYLFISLLFFVMILPNPFKWSEDDDYDECRTINNKGEESKFTIFSLIPILLFVGLSILSIGILFTIKLYPGASINRTVGASLTIVAAIICLTRCNKENSPHYSDLKAICIFAFLFATAAKIDAYWNFLFRMQHSEYQHLCEIYNVNHPHSSPLFEEQNAELGKYFELDSKSYNHFDSLLTKANEMASQQPDAKVIYLLMNYPSKMGGDTGETIFDNKAVCPIDGYAHTNSELFQSKNPFIVVTNDAEAATAKLRKLSSEEKEIIIVK